VLTIRKAQFDALAADLLVQYKDRLLRRFTLAYPEQFSRLGQAGMIAFIDQGVATAQRHKIKTEKDVAEFLNLALKTTGGLDAMIRREPVREILEDDNIAGNFKVQLLSLELTTDVP
jgi:hypothetical protein